MTDPHSTSLCGKHIVITGGGGDIGRSTAEYLGALGARIGLLDVDSNRLADVSQHLSKQAVQVDSIRCDVTDPDSVSHAIGRLNDRFGPIHGLFNNVGYQGEFTPAHEYSLADFQRVMSINVTGAFIVLQTVAQIMVRQGGGAIVNTASMAAVGGPPNMVAYAASKAALLGMTQTAATDLAPFGVRVNAISPAYMGPGAMWTRQVQLQAAAGSQYFSSDPGDVEQQMIGSVPMRRYGYIDEIPGAVEFLLSDRASYISGINLPISGGMQ